MLPRKALFDYSLLAVPLAFAGMPLYIHAPDFYATQHGISLSALALILLFLRVVDAIQDPLIGAVSDRWSHKRYAIMLGALLVLVAGFFALFQPVAGMATIWFAIMMLLATTAFSVLTVNLNALGALWSADKSQQTRITASREGVALLGLIFAVIMPAALQNAMSPTMAFGWMGAILAVFSLIAFWRFTRWYHHHQSEALAHNVASLGMLKRTVKSLSSPMKRFYLIYSISMLASAIPAILVLFFIRDKLDLEAYTGVFLAVYFLSGVAGMPLWKYITRHYSAQCAWLISMVVAVASFVSAFLLGAGDFVPYLLICATSGLALGGDLALPPAILANFVHEEKTQSSASVQFALLTFLSKTALAASAAIALPALEWFGFEAGGNNSNQALFALSAIYALLPCFIKLAALLLLWRTMDREKNHENHRNHLISRRQPFAE